MIQDRKVDVWKRGIVGVVFLFQLIQGNPLQWTTSGNVSCSNCTGTPGLLLCRETCPPAFYTVLASWAQCHEGNDTTGPTLNNASSGERGAPDVICAQCDDACADCMGPGSQNCSACAEGYEKASQTAGASKTCIKVKEPPGENDTTTVVLSVMSGVALIAIASICFFVWRRRQKNRPKLCSAFGSFKNINRSENPRWPQQKSDNTTPVTLHSSTFGESDHHKPDVAESKESRVSARRRQKERRTKSFSEVSDENKQESRLRNSDSLRRKKNRRSSQRHLSDSESTFLRVANASNSSRKKRREPCGREITGASGGEAADNAHTENIDVPLSQSLGSEHTVDIHTPYCCDTDRKHAVPGQNRIDAHYVKPGAKAGARPRRELSEEDQASSGYASDESRMTNKSMTSLQNRLSLLPRDSHMHTEQHDISVESLQFVSSSSGFRADLSKSEGKGSLENMSITEMTSTPTQTDASVDGCLEPPMLSKKWQFSREFSAAGGILQGERSDVVLKVPRGAVQYEEIHGAVSVDLPKVRTLSKLPDSEILASPIVEYHAKNNCKFKVPLEICLPHFLPSDIGEAEVKVYEFSADKFGMWQLKVLKPSQKNNLQQEDALGEAGIYYFGEDSVMHIFVKHFTGYFCVFECKRNFLEPCLSLHLYASHVEVSGKRRITVRLNVWDSRLDIKDFFQASHESLQDKQLELFDKNHLQRLTCQVDMDSVAVGVKLEMAEEDELFWVHSKDRAGSYKESVEQVVRFHTLVPCKCQPDSPKIKQWLLENKRGSSPPDVFECSVYAGYVKIEHDEARSPMEFVSSPAKVCMNVASRKSVGPADQSDNHDLPSQDCYRFRAEKLSSGMQSPGINEEEISSFYAKEKTTFLRSQHKVLNNEVSLESTEAKEAGGGPTHKETATLDSAKLARAEGGVSLPRNDKKTEKKDRVVNLIYNAKYVSFPAGGDCQRRPNNREDTDTGTEVDGSESPRSEPREQPRKQVTEV